MEMDPLYNEPQLVRIDHCRPLTDMTPSQCQQLTRAHGVCHRSEKSCDDVIHLGRGPDQRLNPKCLYK